MYLGRLWDALLAQKMYETAPDPFLKLISGESKITTVGFYDIPALCKQYALPIPKLEPLLKAVTGSRTIFSRYGIKSTSTEKEILTAIRRLVRSGV